MGKGDKKTKKGKISMGSYGVTRPQRKKKVDITAVKSAKPAKAKKEEKAVKEDKPKKKTKKKED
jgi:30S ribosomal protein S31